MAESLGDPPTEELLGVTSIYFFGLVEEESDSKSKRCMAVMYALAMISGMLFNQIK